MELTINEVEEILRKVEERKNRPKNGVKRKKTPMRPAKFLSDCMAGYIAGFIDADGCISGSAIYICNTDLRALMLYQHFIGGNIATQGGISNGKRKQGYQLCLRNIEQKALLPQIIPYMVIKQEKAINRLKELEIRIDGRSKSKVKRLTKKKSGV